MAPRWWLEGEERKAEEARLRRVLLRQQQEGGEERKAEEERLRQEVLHSQEYAQLQEEEALIRERAMPRLAKEEL